jgi:predicted phage baseplate assembly protein
MTTFTSSRGRIDPPNLDDRTWADLVDQMRALIPTYAPSWTDQNPSDLGITLIELFAWLGETILYRLNQTPVKNYVAFLNLLGIVRSPAAPAETYLTFTTQTPGTAVPAGTQAQTPATGTEQPIVFETDEPVSLLPTTLAAALIVGPYPSAAASASYIDATELLVGPPTGRMALTVPANQVLTVALGFRSSTTDEVRLNLLLDRALAAGSGVDARWIYGAGATEPMAWPDVPGVRDGTLGMTRSGVVRVTLPANWAAHRPTAADGNPDDQAWSTVKPASPDQAVTEQLFWIGVRLTNPTAAAVSVRIDRLLFNAAPARTAATIRTPEALGTSTGAAFQVFPLAHRPVYRGSTIDPSYDHLVVQVGIGSPPSWETWERVDQLAAGDGKTYVLNPTTAEVRFGDFDAQHPGGHGLIPRQGSSIQALSYRYVTAGAAGNVAAAQVIALGTTLSGGRPAGVTQVINLGPGIGGVDEEPIDDILSRAPEEFKVRNRAVTAEDYEFLARQPSFVTRSRCLEPRFHRVASTANPPLWKVGDPWTFGAIERDRGNVTVIVVPDQGPDVARPEPTAEQLAEVQGYLDQRRDLTARLSVVGPRYLPVAVTVVIMVWPAAISAGVDLIGLKADTLDRIRHYLHPTRGGLDGGGWQIGQSVFTSDLFRALEPAEDIGFISDLKITATTPSYHFPPLNPGGTSDNWKPADERPFDLGGGTSLRLADYELVCAAADSAHLISTPTLPD